MDTKLITSTINMFFMSYTAFDEYIFPLIMIQADVDGDDDASNAFWLVDWASSKMNRANFRQFFLKKSYIISRKELRINSSWFWVFSKWLRLIWTNQNCRDSCTINKQVYSLGETHFPVFICKEEIMVKQKGSFRPWSSLRIELFYFNVVLGKATSTHELMLTTISDVVKQLIDAYEQGKDIDLNK